MLLLHRLHISMSIYYDDDFKKERKNFICHLRAVRVSNFRTTNRALKGGLFSSLLRGGGGLLSSYIRCIVCSAMYFCVIAERINWLY